MTSHEDRDSLKRQLGNLRYNLRLIEEKMSEFVEPSQIPLQLEREKQETKARIADLEAQLAALEEVSRTAAPAGSPKPGEAREMTKQQETGRAQEQVGLPAQPSVPGAGGGEGGNDNNDSSRPVSLEVRRSLFLLVASFLIAAGGILLFFQFFQCFIVYKFHNEALAAILAVLLSAAAAAVSAILPAAWRRYYLAVTGGIIIALIFGIMIAIIKPPPAESDCFPPTPTLSLTATATSTSSPGLSPPVPTDTPTATFTPSPTSTRTSTATFTPSSTPTDTLIYTPTSTPSLTLTPTITPIPLPTLVPAPTLKEPTEGTSYIGQVPFRWEWIRVLRNEGNYEGEYVAIRVWPKGQMEKKQSIMWIKESEKPWEPDWSHYPPGEYCSNAAVVLQTGDPRSEKWKYVSLESVEVCFTMQQPIPTPTPTDIW